MNRFFRSGLLPLILIVLVVYLASSQLMGNKNNEKKVTYSEFINKVETDQIESAVFNPNKRKLSFEEKSGKKGSVNYPSDQSATGLTTLDEAERRRLRLEGHRHVRLVVPADRPPAVRPPLRLLDLPDESGPGRRLEGDELRQEPRQADDARLAEDRLQGRCGRRRGRRGAPRDQGVPREPEEVPGAGRANPEGRSPLRAARHR